MIKNSTTMTKAEKSNSLLIKPDKKENIKDQSPINSNSKTSQNQKEIYLIDYFLKLNGSTTGLLQT
jgi:hypothetical protein